MQNDTIAAIATGLTNAGVSIIRISGTAAFSVAGRLFCRRQNDAPMGEALREIPSHTVQHGYLVQKDILLDEVLAVFMKAPRTYTREDVVELQCHGGIQVTLRVLDAVLACGARLAEPGEFTKRAFLNGRIDLMQAEAVMELVRAKSEAARQNSMLQLQGQMSDKIRRLREVILHDTAMIEAAIDDPEHLSLEGFSTLLRGHMQEVNDTLLRLLRSAEAGRLLTEGIKTVILGTPNVGKSTLLNYFAGTERAIVTDIPGTTRDSIKEEIRLGSVLLTLVDTAGLRETADTVERIGVEKALREAANADLILFVMDASELSSSEEEQLLSYLRTEAETPEPQLSMKEPLKEKYAALRDKKAVILLNKSDLPQRREPNEIERQTGRKVISISAKTAAGIDQLEQWIREEFFAGALEAEQEGLITGLRQTEALREAKDAIEKVMAGIADGLPEDFYTIDLMTAYERLGSLLGEAIEDDLADKIFLEFCMGK